MDTQPSRCSSPRAFLLARSLPALVLVWNILVATPLLLAASSARAEPQGGRVLVLHSYHPGYAWTENVNQGVRSVLEADGSGVSLGFEYMDSKRNPVELVLYPLFALYRLKYRESRPDCIIACDDNALNFLLMYRDWIFPGVPVVFCGVNLDSRERLRRAPNVTGLDEDLDLRGTLEVALDLHPEASTVAVVSDITTTGQKSLAQFKALARPFAEGRTFSYLNGLSADDLCARLSGLPRGSVVISLSYFATPAGRTFSPRESAAFLAGCTEAPIYSCWDTMLLPGIVGGMMVSGRDQGRIAAEMAASILEGMPVGAIPIRMDSPAVPMFNHPELERLGLEEGELPQGSLVLNKPRSFFRQYWWQTLLAAGLFVLETLLVLVLLDSLKKQRRVQRQLRESEATFRLLAENSSDVIWTVDPSGRFSYVSPAVQEMFGYAAEEACQLTLSEQLLPESRRALDSEMARFPQQEPRPEKRPEPARLELRQRRRDGSVLWTEVVLAPLYGSDGQLKGFQGSSRDITDRKQAEEAALKAKQAEAASKAKTDFLACMSHEIRTPLHSILGMLRLCLEGDLSMKQRRRLQVAQDSAESLVRLLNDLLDLSKIESEEFTIDPAVFRLEALVTSVISEQRVAAEAKGLELRFSLDSGLPAYVRTDPQRLRQVLVNLLSNAIKFTVEGEVAVHAEPGRAGQPNRHEDLLRIAVEDSGIGIREEDLETVFKSYLQLEDALSGSSRGIGLGLAISRRIVTSLGGRIWAESGLGQGSRFVFEVPVGTAEGPEDGEAEPIPAPEADLPQLRVLLVEDQRMSRIFAADLLSSKGHSVVEAENGQQALEKLEKEVFDLVLMDIRMPVMDGITATWRIRSVEQESLDPDIPIIGLSGQTEGESRLQGMDAAGMDALLVKPMTDEALFATVRRVLADKGRLSRG